MHEAELVGVSPGISPMVDWGYFVILVLAIIHTFFTKQFEHIAHINLDRYDFKNRTVKNGNSEKPYLVDRAFARSESLARFTERHSGMFNLLGEVEIVFPIWAFVLLLFIGITDSSAQMLAYFDSRNPTEPMFVFAIMVVAASRPVKMFAASIMTTISRVIPVTKMVSLLFVLLAIGPCLGSIITEAAAMTIVALLLGGYYFKNLSGPKYHALRYRILATLFVNISIGGVLTHYAAPPVLMVARKWGWDTPFMFTHFGIYAMIAVVVNTLLVIALHYKQLILLPATESVNGNNNKIPAALTFFHLVILAGIVYFAHHPTMFMTFLGIYVGLASAYPEHQDEKLFFRESIKVGLFLWGLVIIGGKQQWWLQPILTSMDDTSLYFSAVGLTAFTDNAALTYLGSTVKGLSDTAKHMLVAGAVAGGGLTIIANAPNPAGISILKEYFGDETISPKSLLLYALMPTAIATGAFLVLPLIF